MSSSFSTTDLPLLSIPLFVMGGVRVYRGNLDFRLHTLGLATLGALHWAARPPPAARETPCRARAMALFAASLGGTILWLFSLRAVPLALAIGPSATAISLAWLCTLVKGEPIHRTPPRPPTILEATPRARDIDRWVTHLTAPDWTDTETSALAITHLTLTQPTEDFWRGVLPMPRIEQVTLMEAPFITSLERLDWLKESSTLRRLKLNGFRLPPAWKEPLEQSYIAIHEKENYVILERLRPLELA